MDEQVQSQWTNGLEEPSGEKDRFLQVAAEGCIENFKRSFSQNSDLVLFILSCPLLALQPAGADVPVELCLLEKLLLSHGSPSDTIHPIPGTVMDTLFAAAGPFLPLSWVSTKLRWEVQEAQQTLPELGSLLASAGQGQSGRQHSCQLCSGFPRAAHCPQIQRAWEFKEGKKKQKKWETTEEGEQNIFKALQHQLTSAASAGHSPVRAVFGRMAHLCSIIKGVILSCLLH